MKTAMLAIIASSLAEMNHHPILAMFWSFAAIVLTVIAVIKAVYRYKAACQ